jgi:hypothetical protein
MIGAFDQALCHAGHCRRALSFRPYVAFELRQTWIVVGIDEQHARAAPG